MMTFLLSKSLFLLLLVVVLLSNSFIIQINGQVQQDEDEECTIIGYQLVIPTQDISSIEYTMLDIYGRDDVEPLDDKYIVCTSNTYGDTIQAILSPSCFTNNSTNKTNTIAVEFVLRNVSGATIQYYNSTNTNPITNITATKNSKQQRTILPILHQSIQTSFPYYLYGTNISVENNNKTTTTILGGIPPPSLNTNNNYGSPFYSWPPGKYRIVSYIVNKKNTTRKSINFELINCAYYRSINECPMKCPTVTVTTPTTSPTSKPIPTKTSKPIPTKTSKPIPTKTSKPIPTKTSKPIPTKTTKKPLLPTKKPVKSVVPTKNSKPIPLSPSKPITIGNNNTNTNSTTTTTNIKAVAVNKPLPISKPIELVNETSTNVNKDVCEGGVCIPTGMLRITLISYGINTWDYNINVTSPFNTTISTTSRKLYTDSITGGSVTHNTMYLGTCKSSGIWIKNIIYPIKLTGTYSIAIQDTNVCKFSSSLPLTNTRYYKLKIRYNYNTTIIPKRMISLRRNNNTIINNKPKNGIITTTSSNSNNSPILHKYRFRI